MKAMKANIILIFSLVVYSGAPIVYSSSVLRSRRLDVTSGNVNTQHDFEIPDTGVYSVSLKHEPNEILFPESEITSLSSNKDKYEITLSSAVSQVTTCRNQLRDAIGCYSCNAAPCYIRLNIKDVKVSDGGMYSGTIKDNRGTESETNKLELIVYARPRVLPVTVNGKEYASGATVTVTPGQTYTVVVTVTDFFPRLVPGCATLTHHLQEASHSETTFDNADEPNLQKIVIEQPIVPNENIEKLVDCTFTVNDEDSADIPPFQVYLNAVVPGRASETSTAAATDKDDQDGNSAERSSSVAAYGHIVMMVVLAASLQLLF